MNKFLLVAFALAALPACSRSTATPPKAPAAAQAKPAAKAKAPSQVAVLETRSVNRSTELLGFIDVSGDKTSKGAALEALRAKAAALGADAVVAIEYHEGKGEPGHYSGAAVKYRKHRRAFNSQPAK